MKKFVEINRILAALCFILVLVGCKATSFIKTELYFGLSLPSGGQITPEQWQFFVDTAITPRFPDGLSIGTLEGQWRNRITGELDREPSRVVIFVYPRKNAQSVGSRLEQIKASYYKTFQQQAVMRVDSQVKVSF